MPSARGLEMTGLRCGMRVIGQVQLHFVVDITDVLEYHELPDVFGTLSFCMHCLYVFGGLDSITGIVP